MADLSQLSDEQLEVYRDLLVKKSQTNPSDSIPKAKPPDPIMAEGRMDTAKRSLPGSLLRAVTHPSFPGMPVGQPQTQPGEPLGPTPEKLGREISSFGHGIMHPEEDPVGSALNVAALGRGFAKHGTATEPVSPEGLTEMGTGAAKGAWKGATTMVPTRHYGVPFDVPAPVAGAIAGGFAGLPFRHFGGGDLASGVGAGIGAVSPVVKGAVGGARGSLSDILARGRPSPFAEDFMGPSNMPPTSGQALEALTGEKPSDISDLPDSGGAGSIKKQSLKFTPGKPQKLQAHPGIVGGNKLPDVAPPGEVAPQETDIPGGQVGSIRKQAMRFSPARRSAGNVARPGIAGRSKWGGLPEPPVPEEPIEAAMDEHPPGTTQADEFLPPKGVMPSPPPSGLTPQGGAISPQGPPTPHPADVIKPGSGAPGDVNGPPGRVLSPSEVKHHAYTDTKHENIKNYVLDKENGITPEFLKKLRDDITQVDDPQLQAHTIEIAKGLGADVGRHAVKNGNPASKYGTFNLQDINIALKHLKGK